MNYDQFRTLWHEALDAAGLVPLGYRPSEAMDLHLLSRTYSVIVALEQRPRVGPFTVTARLSWKWDAVLAARSATTEEDLLVELLGQDGYYLTTEQPWLRVDATLRATLPLDSPTPLPGTDAWRRWVTEVTTRLEPLFPRGEEDTDEQWPAVLCWRDEPTVQLRCDHDGWLYLTGVELSAWQRIGLPRQWDNPDRPSDEGMEEQVDDLAGRVYRALGEWGDSLRLLH